VSSLANERLTAMMAQLETLKQLEAANTAALATSANIFGAQTQSRAKVSAF
jgi:hypothetical protein